MVGIFEYFVEYCYGNDWFDCLIIVDLVELVVDVVV